MIDHDVSKLTEREREVLRLLAQGYDIKTAALELSISASAVSDRLRQARRKLGVSSSREAARVLMAHESDGTFDVHRFLGIPNTSIPPHSVRLGIFARNGVAMTMLIAAGVLISIVAVSHPTSNADGALHRPIDCRAFATAHAKNGAHRSSGTVHFDTSARGKRAVSPSATGPKKKEEFCIAD